MKILFDWLKTFLLFSMTTLLFNYLYAVNIDDGDITTCSGNFYDTGGPGS